MIRLKRLIESAKERLITAYHQQPEVVSIRPLKLRLHPDPMPFQMKGVIHDTCERSTIAHSGSSPHINIPNEWKEQLTPPFILHLYETNRKGIIIEEVGGKP